MSASHSATEMAEGKSFMDEIPPTEECDGEPMKKKSKSSVRKKIVFRDSGSFRGKDEKESLRSELSSVHRAYQKNIRDKDEEIETLKKNLMTLSSLFSNDIDSLQKELDMVEDENEVLQESEKEWIGRTLKLKFIFDEIKKVGALPKDHSEWVEPMVEQVVIPGVSINIKDEFIPTAQTENVDWTDEEGEGEDEENDERPGYMVRLDGEWRWSLGMPVEGTMINMFDPRTDRWVMRDYNYPRAILERSARIIQKYWRDRSHS
jgi:hypothetical protein